MTDRTAEISRAMGDAELVCDALREAFGAWVKERPDGSVVVMGAGTGVAKLAGLILGQIGSEHERDTAVSGAVATLLVNSGCNAEVVLAFAAEAMRQYALSTGEVAGHA